MKEYLYIDSNDNHQTKFKVSKTPKLDYLIKEKRFNEALTEINTLLKTEDNYTNWNLKGIILNHLNKYEESIDAFNKALNITKSKEIQSNKAKALYNLAKITFFPENNYEKALTLINESLNTLPHDEDPSEYYFLKAEIYEALNQLDESYKNYLKAYKEFKKLEEFEKQKEYLKTTSDTLITIAGNEFYNHTPKNEEIIQLVKDEKNKHDKDAIAIISNDEIIGYVANNPYTLIEEVKSASDIKNIINDNQKAKILFIYMNEHIIAKLL